VLLDALQFAAATTGKTLKVREARHLKRSTDPDNGVADRTLEAINCRMLKPVAKMAPAVMSNAGFAVVKCGFRLAVPAEVVIQWLCFRVDVSNEKEGSDDRANAIVSFFPRSIESDVVVSERIIMDDSGTISRAIVDPADAGIGGVRFTRLLLGFATSSRSHVAWSFVSTDGHPPVTSDNFLLAVNARHPNSKLSVTVSLDMSVRTNMTEEASLECPAETFEIGLTQ
jgi:hypothetical protein